MEGICGVTGTRLVPTIMILFLLLLLVFSVIDTVDI